MASQSNTLPPSANKELSHPSLASIAAPTTTPGSTSASSTIEKGHSSSKPSPLPAQALPENEYQDAEQNYNTQSSQFWLIILSVYLSFFLVALDRMIIATAIPAITNTFQSIEDIGWYGSAYMLTCAIFNPLFGKIYQLYDTKWTYLASIVVFEVGSVVCGAAKSSVVFIIGRAIAGIGAAGVGCGAIMIIIPLVPLRKRPVFTSFFGMAFGISSVLGPFLGGTFTDSHKLTWRWCFYINLPIGAFTLLAVFLFLHLPAKPKEQLSIWAQMKRLDPLGVLFFAPSMVCLILALQWGGTTSPWSAPRVIGLLAAFAVTLIAFLVVEIMLPETAMIPPRVVYNRSVSGAMSFTFLMAGGMMSAVYYISIWFQAAQSQSAMQAGVRTIPMVLSLVVMGILSGIVTQKIGYYVPAMLALPVLTSVGAGLLSTLTPSSGPNKWIGYQVLYGFGLGFGAQASNLVVQTVLPRSDVSLGSALMFLVQQLGGSVFLAVGQNIFSRDLIHHLSGIAGLDAAAIVNTGATELRKIVSQSELIAVIDAYSHAITRVFILTTALSACTMIGALVQEWKSIKGKGQPMEKHLGEGGKSGKEERV